MGTHMHRPISTTKKTLALSSSQHNDSPHPSSSSSNPASQHDDPPNMLPCDKVLATLLTSMKIHKTCYTVTKFWRPLQRMSMILVVKKEIDSHRGGLGSRTIYSC